MKGIIKVIGNRAAEGFVVGVSEGVGRILGSAAKGVVSLDNNALIAAI